MIIKPPRRPKQDSPPGEFPFHMPSPLPTEGRIPANIDPVNGDAPPVWAAYRPDAVREGETVYALFPTEVRFYVCMVGSSPDFTPPEGDIEPWGGVRVWNADGSVHFPNKYAVEHFFIETVDIEAYLAAGWGYCDTFPANFPRPTVFPFEMLSPPSLNFQYALLSAGASRDPYEMENGLLKGVTWGLWNLWRPADVLPGVLWGSLDVYIQSQTFVEFVLLSLTPTHRRAAWMGITPIVITLGLASLCGSVGETSLQSRSRHRNNYVKTDPCG